MQTALAACRTKGFKATLVLPRGTISINETLIFGDIVGTATSFISMIGAGTEATTIRWDGIAAGNPIKLVRNKYFVFSGFNITNNASYDSASIGLLLSGFGGVGTETLAGVFSRMRVQGFGIGIQAGDPSGAGVAASDCLWEWIELNDNDIGWVNYDLNTLNHVFTDLNMVGNVLGLHARVGSVWVRGGSSANNGTDFEVGGAQQFELTDFRAEISNLATLVKLSGVESNVSLSQVVMAGSVPDTNTYALKSTTTNSAAVSVRDCVFTGRIDLSTGGVRSILLENVWVAGETDLPIYTNAQSVNFLQLKTIDVWNYTGPGAGDRYPNMEIEYRNAYPWYGQVTRPHLSSTDIIPRVQLNGVTQISQGSRVDGKNLGGSATFAAGTSVAYTFQRTITCTRTGGGADLEIFSVDSGKIYKSDLGKKIVVTIGGSPVTGYIYSVNETAQTFQWTGTMGGCGSCISVSCVIGEDEPDADYFVDGYSVDGTTPLSLAFSSLTTSGFTITASASNSATVHFAIRR
jgi:hypothetical protein